MKFGTLKLRLIIAALSLIGSFDRVENDEFNEFLLQIYFKPISYTLDITTHLENKFTFEGVVNITIVCKDPFQIVVLHAKKLDIDMKRITIVGYGGMPVEVMDAWLVPEVDSIYIKTVRNFELEEEFVLTIPFAGRITDDMVGYYRSSYVDELTKQTKWLAVTRFEPTYAREAFPCFDEPAMKAKFKIKLRHSKELTSVSNMRLKKTSPDPSNPDYVLDEFEESEPMSTYLVAYMVSDLTYVNADLVEPNDMHFRLIGRKDAVGHMELAKNVGAMALAYLKVQLDEKFPNTKIDMAVLPESARGATESWGLITYRETALLTDTNVDTIDDLHRVVRTVVHQVGHMWFGNLVTMKWWTDLWMKEAFATYYASRFMGKLYPRWSLYQLETVENFISVMEMDSLQSSHPVSWTINDPDETAQLLDTITHKKGSYLLHMLNQFLGEKIFKQSVRNFVDKYKFANADQDDLWETLINETRRVGGMPKKRDLTFEPSQQTKTEGGDSSGNSTIRKKSRPRSILINNIMDLWTWQPGYPVVTVIRNYTAGYVNITQRRFFALRSKETEKEINCWWVPLTMTTASEADFTRTKAQYWFHYDQNGKTTLPLAKTEEWVIFNIRMTGLYRVMYDKYNWLSIIYTLNHPDDFREIYPVNRAQLIDDALTFSQFGDLDYGITFKLLAYLRYENEHIPWMAVIRRLSPIGRLMKRTPNHGVYQAYMRRLLKPVYMQDHDLTYDPNQFEETRLKNLIVSEACHNGLKNCTDQAQQLFQKWMKSPDPDGNNTLPREQRSTINCEAARHGREEVWDFLWKRYERSRVPAEKLKYLRALGCTTDPWLLRRYLKWSIGEHAIIRKQDAFLVFQSVAANEHGYHLAKEFLYRNFKEISKHYHHRIGGYVKAIGIEMKTKKELDELHSFVYRAMDYLKGAEISVSQTVETVKMNIEWMTKFHEIFLYHIDLEKAKERRRLARLGIIQLPG